MIELWKGAKLPDDAVTQTFAFIGRRGSGKTYAAGRLAEELIRARHQVVTLDWVGNWWGLRLDKSGKKPSGLEVAILGGDHADVAISPESGAAVARAIAARRFSAVIDISPWSQAKRESFATAFAEELFHAKHRQRSPMHLIVEEAHGFAPQHTAKNGASSRMLGAFQELLRVGRNRGIGATLVTQRPQAVSKEVLNQAEIMLAFQLTGPHEREAVLHWVKENIDKKEKPPKFSDLPSGVAIAWSPGWLKFFGRVEIQEKTTFDASSTPTRDTTEPCEIEPIDADAIRDAIGETLDAAEEDDPKKLRAKIAALEARLETEEERDPPDAEVVDDLIRKLSAAEDRATRAEEEIEILRGHAATLLPVVEDAVLRAKRMIERAESTQRPAPAPRTFFLNETHELPRGQKNTTAAAARPRSDGDGAARMLHALAAFHPKRLTRRQLATQALLKMSGGSFRTYLSKLRAAKWIEEPMPGEIGLTAAGVKEAGDVAPIENLIDQWRGLLSGGAQRMFDVVITAYPKEITHGLLAELAELDPNGGSYRTYLSKLVSNGLAVRVVGRGAVRAADELFMGQEKRRAS